MDNIAGTKSSLTWAVHISVALLVALWLFPTVGLLVSSFRTADQIANSGWWASMFAAQQSEAYRTADPSQARVPDGDLYVVEGNLFEVAGVAPRRISTWGVSARDVAAFEPDDTADMGDGQTLTVSEDGAYVWRGSEDQLAGRGQRIFATVTAPPEFTLANYEQVLFSGNRTDSMARPFSTR
jgi:alpha-glucoside transport system permease protein